jgi:hypothetical protein
MKRLVSGAGFEKALLTRGLEDGRPVRFFGPGHLPPCAIPEPAKERDDRAERDANEESARGAHSDPFRGRRVLLAVGPKRRLVCLVEGGDHLHPSVEAVDDHLTGRVVTSYVRGGFERVAELPEPFDVHSSSAK